MAWKTLKKETVWDDVGGWLLANLARGIYTPEAVLREYVQNARDSYNKLKSIPDDASIRISIENDNSIAIHDNGIGMDEGDLDKAKRIAYSPKAGLEVMAGFRGIGIWAGFEACDKLEVETTKKGTAKRYRLIIDFAEILKYVDKQINLKELLDDRFHVQEDTAPQDEHYTRVRLIDIRKDYASLLSEDELRRVVSQVLPSRVSPTFDHAEAVNEFLESVPGYQAFRITVNGTEAYREFPNGLSEPCFETLEADDGSEYGRVWYISSPKGIAEIKGVQYRSFLLRIKNIAVGSPGIYDDEDGTPFGCDKLSNTVLLRYHVGEIHVTSKLLRPDTPRSSLELDSVSRAAIAKLRAFYSDRIAHSYAISKLASYRKVLTSSDSLDDKNPKHVEKARQDLAILDEANANAKGRLPEKDGQKRKQAQFIRDFLNESKTERAAKIASLKRFIKKAGGTTHAETNGEPKKKAKKKTAKKQTGTQSTADAGTPFDAESVLSDIVAALEEIIDDDADMLEGAVTAIQEVFVSYGLLAVPK